MDYELNSPSTRSVPGTWFPLLCFIIRSVARGYPFGSFPRPFSRASLPFSPSRPCSLPHPSAPPSLPRPTPSPPPTLYLDSLQLLLHSRETSPKVAATSSIKRCLYTLARVISSFFQLSSCLFLLPVLPLLHHSALPASERLTER